MLKILQAKLQQYMNRELPDVQTGFRKGRGTRDQIANIHWILEKAREFQKNIYFCLMGCKELDMTERLTLYLYCCYLVTKLRIILFFFFFKLCLILSTAWTSQARTLEWVAISSSREPSQPRDRTHISCLADGFFTTEAPGKPYTYTYMGCKESDTTEQLLHTHSRVHTHIHTKKFTVKSWLMKLQRLSSPTVCCL